ncbi:glycopeptide [Daedaleopsis nitida]|nr:glycopeptide [Daedaleopsis nitida]
MQLSLVVSVVTALVAASLVNAERHVIRFNNRCGKGTPRLIQAYSVLSTGGDFVSNGPFRAGIAYLQTGNCGFNGEGCSLVEMTLVNPVTPGTGSSSDISLIAPHAFSVPVSFSYFGGCDGQGRVCDHNGCNTAFYSPNDNQVQVQCQANDVNLLVTFC